MNEDSRELEQMKSEIRLEMEEIRKMLVEIKSNTAYFREFMEKYNIPMQEEVVKEQKEITSTLEPKTDVRQKKEITPKLCLYRNSVQRKMVVSFRISKDTRSEIDDRRIQRYRRGLDDHKKGNHVC